MIAPRTQGRDTHGGTQIFAVETVIDNGKHGQRTVKFETGLLARQAAGSVTAYLDDDTMLLSATTAGKHPKDHFDFFPLTIDVEERMYAAGRIPGSFFRREGRPSEDAILTCRLIDRPLRPTFKKGLRNEVQVVITVLALDPDTPYDVLAINAASASTRSPACRSPARSVAPASRSSRASGSRSRRTASSRTPSSTWSWPAVTESGDVAIMMVEAESTESTWNLVQSGTQAPTEEVVAGGLDAAKPFIKQLCEAQAELAKQAAKPVQEFPIFLDYEDDVYAAVEAAATADLTPRSPSPARTARGRPGRRQGDRPGEEGRRRVRGREKEVGAAFRSLTKRPSASACCARRSAWTAAASPTSGPCPPRSA